MGYLFGHHSGNPIVTARAISILQEFDTFFSRHTATDYVRPPLVGQLLKHKKRLEEGMGKGEFCLTVCDASNISTVYVYNGMNSGVSWKASMSARRLVFENMRAMPAEQLFKRANHHNCILTASHP